VNGSLKGRGKEIAFAELVGEILLLVIALVLSSVIALSGLAAEKSFAEPTSRVVVTDSPDVLGPGNGTFVVSFVGGVPIRYSDLTVVVRDGDYHLIDVVTFRVTGNDVTVQSKYFKHINFTDADRRFGVGDSVELVLRKGLPSNPFTPGMYEISVWNGDVMVASFRIEIG